jgi:ketopantoate reductase
MRAKLVVTVAVSSVFALTACDASASGSPPSKSEICAQALGSAVLGEIGDAAQRDAEHAKELADLFSKLSTQTQDQELSKALSDAAQTAGQAAVNHLTNGDLVKWAQQEADRINTLRKVCAS